MSDFVVTDYGRLATIQPSSSRGERWAYDHIPEEFARYEGYLVERRELTSILDKIAGAGMFIRTGGMT